MLQEAYVFMGSGYTGIVGGAGNHLFEAMLEKAGRNSGQVGGLACRDEAGQAESDGRR